MTDIEIIQQNSEHFIGKDELQERIAQNKELRVKLGVDPTRPDLTFGHMVVFNKLRQFQDLGHKAVLIIGDYTASIGDPSGRSALRPVLSKEEIKQNAQSYLDQAFKVLDKDKTEVVYNSEWFDKMSFGDLLNLSRRMTVARMLERDDFSKRYASNTPISIVEFLYPLVQGYDSVMVKSDIELGGSDQLFNNLVGRDFLDQEGMPKQAVLTMPLLVGLDGKKKMSKSYDNYISFNDEPRSMFGKIMSISDETMWVYYQYLLLKTPSEIIELKQLHPMQCKKSLALELLTKFYGEEAAKKELENFEKVFSKNEIPEEMPEFSFSQLSQSEEESLINIMAATKLFPSKKEARRMIEQGAVKINSQKESDVFCSLKAPEESLVIQAGKRIFFRLTK
ncbi:MAG: tyrosine--tRNA ligase [Opitutales bacterium]